MNVELRAEPFTKRQQRQSQMDSNCDIDDIPRPLVEIQQMIAFGCKDDSGRLVVADEDAFQRGLHDIFSTTQQRYPVSGTRTAQQRSRRICRPTRVLGRRSSRSTPSAIIASTTSTTARRRASTTLGRSSRSSSSSSAPIKCRLADSGSSTSSASEGKPRDVAARRLFLSPSHRRRTTGTSSTVARSSASSRSGAQATTSAS